MDISKWTVEDFVLDPGFRKWLLSADAETNLVWEEQLSKSPEKLKEIQLAREILINLSDKSYQFSGHDKEEIWKKLEMEIERIQGEGITKKLFP